MYAWLGVEPPRGLLLHGPPGCGKTALAHAIANQCGVPFLKISAPEIVSGMSGDDGVHRVCQAELPVAAMCGLFQSFCANEQQLLLCKASRNKEH